MVRLRFALGLMLLIANGCAVPRILPPPDLPHPHGVDCYVAAARVDLPVGLANLIENPLSSAIPERGSTAPARNILVLSGGGRDGAYSAGVLTGWSATGSRPSFDVVTGISTGALIAPLAFLGTRYDKVLAENYTSVHTEDIYRKRPWPSLLWADSLADSSPLRRRIDAQITDEFLAEIAHAHAAGRRLYVGTTNLHSGRLILWDLGAIASGTDSKKRELFRDVLLASCSIPGLLPPVPIEIEVDGKRYKELHVDGGVSASLFLTPYMALGERRDMQTNVYVVVAGRLSSTPQSVKPRLLAISEGSLQKLLVTQTRTDLLRTYLLTRLVGGRFAVASVPPALAISPDSTTFDLKDMRQLYDAGYQQAKDGKAWNPLPPGVDPEEWTWPRTGTSFATH